MQVRRCFRTRVALPVVLAVAVGCPGISNSSRADTPLAAAAVPYAVAAGAAAVGAGVTWALNRLFAPAPTPPPKVKSKKKTTVTVTYPDGTKIKVEQESNQEDRRGFQDPPRVHQYPAGWIPPVTIPGDLTAGSTTWSHDPDGYLATQLVPAGTQFGHNIIPQFLALGGESAVMESEHQLSSTGYMERPDGPAVPSLVQFTLSGGMIISTVASPETSATSSFLVRIASDELGLLFEGGVSIDEESNTWTVLGAGLPNATYQLLGPGIVRVDFNGTISAPIPDGVNLVNYTHDTLMVGTAFVPEPMMLPSIALGALLLRRRR